MQYKSVLIVDDEPKILDVVKSFLESKGFTAYIAATGTDALQIFNEQEISIVLLDLMLPDIQGESICRTIRQKSRVPIIMLTAKISEESMLEGLGIGADDYITKPFSLKALYARMEAVMRRSSEDISALYNKCTWNDNDLEIDFSSHEVKKSGVVVNLTKNEYKLLTTLVKYPGRVYSRDELIAFAFDDTYEGFDRAIDSHIKNIRHKIESDPKNPVYIVTVHGMGYKFSGV